MQVEFGTDAVSEGEQFIWPSKRDWGARYNSILIYDDDDISVVFFSRNSDFLLITFGDLVNLAEGNRFYAEQPVKKAGFNCLGFMAKTANWFPAASVVAACERTAAIIAHFDHRVTYGGSMGGYAAIKFSALFEADLVIAFCPQWTLDGDECDGTNPGWSTYFQPRMKGMSIKSSDVAGKLYCFVDMQDPTDRFHIQKIAAMADKPTIVNVPMCSHHVTAVLAGTENLQSIISLCRSHSVDDLVYTVAKIRRKSILRKIIVMQRLLYKSPVLRSIFFMHIKGIWTSISLLLN